jgi:hypothetical protein
MELPMPNRVRGRLVIALSLFLLGVAATSTAASAPKAARCATAAEMQAIAGRVLETELLVGALSCSQAQQYNAFMEKFRGPQTERARTLQAMFNRMYGKGGQRELDAFVTRLGNDSALRSLELQIAYCQATWDLFEEASRLPVNEYHQLTAKPWIAGRHSYQMCGDAPERSTKTVKK